MENNNLPTNNNNQNNPVPSGPSLTPVQPIQPQTLPPAPVQYPTAPVAPKKSNKGLIVGITIGAVTLILLIGTVLTYLLWWQNPKKILSDAVVSAATAEQLTSSGQIKYKTDDGLFTLTFDSRKYSSQFAGTANLKIKLNNIDNELMVKLHGVMSDDGTFYFKATELDKIIDSLVDSMIKAAAEESGYRESDLSIYKSQVHSYLDPIVDKVNNQWVKMSSKDLTDNGSSKQSQCLLDAITDLNKDPEQSKELIATYRQNEFMFIKSTQSNDKGHTGYEIDLQSKEMKDKFQQFSKASEETKFAKAVKECTELGSSADNSVLDDDDTDESVSMKLIIWVNPWTHSLEGLDLKVENKDDNTTVELSQGFNVGKSEKIEVPSNAKSIEDLSEDLQEIVSGFGDSSYSNSYNDGYGTPTSYYNYNSIYN